MKTRPVRCKMLSCIAQVMFAAALGTVAFGLRGSQAGDQPATIRNKVGMTLTLIPAGEFLMGSSSEQAERDARLPFRNKQNLDDEQPQHRVQITRPFYLGVTEVTTGQFLKVARSSGFKTETERDGRDGWGWGVNAARRGFERHRKFSWRFTGVPQTERHPVVNVSWNDAVAFCNELSKHEGLQPYYRLDTLTILGGDGYRLPTEAEWEYACRAGTTSRYYCGDEPELLTTVGNIADVALVDAGFPINLDVPIRNRSDGHVFTAPVGEFKPNAIGLYDMHGNVGEYCWDPYSPNYYKQSPTADPTGPVWASERVIRGGSWFESPSDVRSVERVGVLPSSRSNYSGFRVARSPSSR